MKQNTPRLCKRYSSSSHKAYWYQLSRLAGQECSGSQVAQPLHGPQQNQQQRCAHGLREGTVENGEHIFGSDPQDFAPCALLFP